MIKGEINGNTLNENGITIKRQVIFALVAFPLKPGMSKQGNWQKYKLKSGNFYNWILFLLFVDCSSFWCTNKKSTDKLPERVNSVR